MDSQERSQYRIVSYESDALHRDGLFVLMRQLYKECLHAQMHIASIQHLLEEKNPCLKHVTMRKVIVYHGTKPVGHIAAIVDERLRTTGIGFVGFYECIDSKAVSAMLFDAARDILRQQGCSIMRGPVDLTIWHTYRVAIAQGHDTFFLEPLSKEYYAQQFADNGLSLAARYVSAQRSDFATIIPHTKDAYERALAGGVHIRQSTPESFAQDLRIFHDIALRTFTDSWSYVPLTFEEFAHLYTGRKGSVDFRFIEIAYSKDTPIGFCFSVHDPLRKDTIILKTIAVLPEYQKLGVGAALLHSQHSKAHAHGCKQFIYALIRVGNTVTKLPYPGASVIREYQTYEAKLS